MPGRSNRTSLHQWAPIPLRLILGFGFLAHGWAKLSRGPAGFGGILEKIGVPLPLFMAWLTALVEFLGGLALLVGAFVTLVSIPLIITMLVAMFTVHLPHGFSSIKLQGYANGAGQFGQPGYEVNLLYMAGLIALMLWGAGAFSVDEARTRSKRTRAETRAENEQGERDTRSVAR